MQKPSFDTAVRCSFHNTIYDVLVARGFDESLSDSEWDIFWCDKEWIRDVLDKVHLQAHQRINHFRNHFQITRKDLLARNIRRAQKEALRMGNKEMARCLECVPQTYVLPMEYSIFVEVYKAALSQRSVEANKDNAIWWIMKPIGRSQGKGIFIFDKLSQVVNLYVDLLVLSACLWSRYQVGNMSQSGLQWRQWLSSWLSKSRLP